MGMQYEINGKSVELSDNGWLEDLGIWDEDIALQIAANEKVEMTDEHWDIIREARNYFVEFSTVCEPRKFTKLMKKKYGEDRSSQKYIYSLFPFGLIKSANKVAGLPRPKGCS